MLRTLAAVAAFALVAAGCGKSGSTDKKASAPGGSVVKTITISEQEFSLTPSSVSVPKTGTYEFKIENKGQTAHALEVEGNGVEEKTSSISPGQSATLKVKLVKAGSYDMYCPIGNHRAQGMEASLKVGSSTGNGGTSTGNTDTGNGGGYGY
ncbi:MAG: cupredoxin domain-containing protein [Actinomycetota bacterium]|nr:cupredoxin domain-containing protein [Actinomycetota bacterium]